MPDQSAPPPPFDATRRPTTTAAGIYQLLEPQRKTFLDRAREASEYTIPFLIPPEGATGATHYRTPYQGIGARGVNNLASKLLITLFPPNNPFFRLRVSGSEELREAEAGAEDSLRSEIEEALSKIEKSIMDEVETSAVRVDIFEALLHLIVGGNVLLHVPENGHIKVFHLSQYVVKRDPYGNVLKIVTRETVSPSALPGEFLKKIEGEIKEDEKTVDLYTRVERTEENKWNIHQEARGVVIEDTKGAYPEDRLPWMALRFFKINGEDYGRGFVEEYIGDLISLEGLTQAIVEGSAAAAKIIFLVNPNGQTDAKTLHEASNGDFVSGLPDEVAALQLDKLADFRVAKLTIDDIRERLEFAFLLNSAVQRSGERVTAEEIRFMARELEDTLGGVYSILGQELQMPLVSSFMGRMEGAGRLPQLHRDSIHIAVITGLDALGRGHDLQKLQIFLQTVAETFGPDAVAQFMKPQEGIKRIAASQGIETKGLVKTEAELEQDRQLAQTQALTDRLGPNAINQLGKFAQENPEALNQSVSQPTEQQQGQQ